MNEHQDLSYMANLYMALADKTRLRLLNLMHEREICVGYFTDILGKSQPKISRHLAYLRNAGIVEARRDGKWMHYSIRWPQDEDGQFMLKAALNWLSGSSELVSDKQKYGALFGEKTEFEPMAVSFAPDVYDTTDDFEEDEGTDSSAHNELEEFLL